MKGIYIMDSKSSYRNHLSDAVSPYLLQHADNPVDWYPWGEEAIFRAGSEDKPIFLSIGYSACHWCHVMAHESFENTRTAEKLNSSYVCIKVDREEHPGIDEIYMTAVQLMTGSGGWPLSVFLSPDLKPFFGGTYFPPENRNGRIGFPELLDRITTAWHEDRDELLKSSERIMQAIQSYEPAGKGEEPPDPGWVNAAVMRLVAGHDDQYGGFGEAPKFPQPAVLEFLLSQHVLNGRRQALEAARRTLYAMANGGMYDHIGGGFHRYSTDQQWLVPHFEKMLYDNASLANVYLIAYQLTGTPFFSDVARETLDFVLSEMRDAQGGFHSALDADSEGKEGVYYLWSADQIRQILGEDAALFMEAYSIGENGNFDSPEDYHRTLNIPHRKSNTTDPTSETTDDERKRLTDARIRLNESRKKRIRPGTDDKVITTWNCLMISALVRGYRVLRNDAYLQSARTAADYILDEMRSSRTLHRTFRKGTAGEPAYLDDYASMIQACIDLYETTFELHWFETADELARKMIELFQDEKKGGFFYTSDRHPFHLARTKPLYDAALPSGNALAVQALLRLAVMLDSDEYRHIAERTVLLSRGEFGRAPTAFVSMLQGLSRLVFAGFEIALIGPENDPRTQKLIQTVQETYLANGSVVYVDPLADNAAVVRDRMRFLDGKQMKDSSPTAYVCVDYACRPPITDPNELADYIRRYSSERTTA